MFNIFLSLFIIVLISYFMIFYVFKYSSNQKEKVKDLYAEGLDLLVSGKRKSAYKNFKQILIKDSENVKAYLRLGQVLRESKSPSKALKIHKQLLHRKKISFHDEIDLHKNLALDYFFLNKFEKSIKELKLIIKLDKRNEWAFSYLIKVYCKIQDWTNATTYLQKYQEITKNIDNHKIGLYKIQEGRILIKNKMFSEARRKFEESFQVCDDLAVAYYFMGNSYSAESDVAYQKSLKNNFDNNGDEKASDAVLLLEKAIPMWIRYADIKPKQAWMVIYLLKDALFALDRYSEFEDVLKQIIKNDSNNIEAIASLSEMLSHRGEELEAIELIESAIEQAPSSLLVKLIKLKHVAKKEKGSNNNIITNLDEIIHFLVKDEAFQIYKDSNRDPDILWLYETSSDEEAREK